MKRFLLAAATAGLAALSLPAAAADVGVSVSVGQPGFYGQINIGDFPRPQLIYPQPMIIQPGPRNVAPLYLRVPPGHAKHWSKHCREYNACGQPVYFVQDSWYNNVYAPRYRERGDDRGDRRDDRRDERRDDRRDDRGDRGNGHGHGHGKGRD